MPVNDKTPRGGWIPRLALGASINLVALFAAGAAEAPVAVAPGQSLADALQLDGEAWWVCVGGGVPRPLEAQPLPAGDHRVLLLREHAGELIESGWREVTVAGGDPVGPSEPAHIVVDRSPPRATFYATGPHLGGDDSLRLAPHSGVRIVFSDVSGVSDWEASDRHPGSSDQGRWLPGAHHLTVIAGDTAGNRGGAGQLRFEVDGQGPTIDWRIVDEGLPASAGGQPIYRSPVTVAVSAADPSGVATVQALVGDVWQGLAGDRVTVASDELALRASDRLGNWQTTEAHWRYDSEGPEIEVRAPEGEIRDSLVVLPVNGVLTLAVHDAGAGLAESRYRYNRKPFKPLPEALQFVHRGRYKLEIQARDLLGNETVRKFKVRTVNRRGASRRSASGERR